MKPDHVDFIAKSVLYAMGDKSAKLEDIRTIVLAYLPSFAGEIATKAARMYGANPQEAEAKACAAYCLHAFGTES